MEFLRGSVEKTRASLLGHARELHPPDKPPLANLYRTLRCEISKAVVQAEAAGILTVSKRLPSNARLTHCSR